MDDNAKQLIKDWDDFSFLCKLKMCKHLDRSYRDQTTKFLLGGLRKEIGEFMDSLHNEIVDGGTVLKFDPAELLDIANYCMMLTIVNGDSDEDNGKPGT